MVFIYTVKVELQFVFGILLWIKRLCKNSNYNDVCSVWLQSKWLSLHKKILLVTYWRFDGNPNPNPSIYYFYFLKVSLSHSFSSSVPFFSLSLVVGGGGRGTEQNSDDVSVRREGWGRGEGGVREAEAQPTNSLVTMWKSQGMFAGEVLHCIKISAVYNSIAIWFR